MEPPIADQRALLADVAELITGLATDPARLSTKPQLGADELRRRLDELNPERGRDGRQAIEWCVDLLMRGTVHTTNPGYYGLFNPAPAFMGIVADALTAAFNPQLAAWSHAPAANEIEAWLIRYVGRRLRLPSPVGGSFTTGGAEANATAVDLALTRVIPDVGNVGLARASAEPVIYASSESHLAWLKIAATSGIGRHNVRLIPVDAKLRLDPAALEAAINQDLAGGLRPLMVVATAGTTSAGALDPLAALAEIAAAHGCHYHVDAAWGGAAAFSDELRPILAGIELADSVTVDAHKWLSAPMGAGMFITRHPAALQETYRVTTAYMPHAIDETVDPYTSSIQWSRRFIGFKLFLTLLTEGREGIASQLERDTHLGALLRTVLAEDGWQLRNTTPLPLVCFADPDHADDMDYHQAIVDRVVSGGQAWISTTSVAGQPAIRACITNYRTTADDIQHLVAALRAARAQLEAAP